MVIGWLERELKSGEGSEPATSAWPLVEAAQRDVRLPCLLVPQPAHAVLAAEIAVALLPAAFGDFPPEVFQAIQMHDTGWSSSDAQQIQHLRSGAPNAGNAKPVSFVAVSPKEAIEAWIASIDAVEALSPIGAIMVSRHFTYLARNDQAHQRFVQSENSRRRRLEGSKLASGETPGDSDLKRWTGALGFCDLVSLYLLCGLNRDVEFPLAHPSSPEAHTAPQVKMHFSGNKISFSPETVRAGCSLTIQALKHPLPATVSGTVPRVETLRWEVQ